MEQTGFYYNYSSKNKMEIILKADKIGIKNSIDAFIERNQSKIKNKNIYIIAPLKNHFYKIVFNDANDKAPLIALLNALKIDQIKDINQWRFIDTELI